MSATTPAGAFMPAPYDSVGVGTLIGRAWNLFRGDIRRSVSVMLPSLLLNGVAGVLVAIPSSFSASARSGGSYLWTLGICYGIALILITIEFFLRAGSFVVLSRLYRATIELRPPIPIRQAVQELLGKAPGFISVAIALIVTGFFFLIADWAVLTLGIILFSMLAAGLLAPMVASFSAFPFIPIVIGSALFMMMGAGLVGLLSFQCLGCLLPLAAVANCRDNSISAQWREMGRTYAFLWRAPLRAGAFGLALLLCYAVLALALSFPTQAAYFFFLYFNPVAPGVIPLPVSIGASVYGIIVQGIIWPFIFAALTLFWYDCQVRWQGADMRLRLERLRSAMDSADSAA